MLLLIFFLPTVKALSGFSVIKLKVPYSYLVSRTPIFTSTSSTSFNLNDVIYKNCASKMCIAAFHDNSSKYQLLTDVQNSCTKAPNCLAFTESQYNIAIVFMNNTSNECSANTTELLTEKFKPKECPAKWFPWTRPNGQIWCHMISSVGRTYQEASDYCQGMGAEMNGFQTVEERNAFIGFLKAKPASSIISWVYIGAKRSCPTDTCAKTVQFQWQNGVSTNHSLANDNFYSPWWEGLGNCLGMLYYKEGMYDDTECVQKAAASCGMLAK
ncbi:C-type lectin domain-containing protein [Caenorhabditis elegans]|uniref:C-type lectin domain-containing protein n=1 Tax=Caenorhabditis elegans TaxID=6239 RepID=Q95XW1_CAEEL|nr:C-type lectin domain-containing protein [Caenorhabditis elegans]CCD70962.2 C-type lectin domain-containing protein [Caenorhabditis elegans]|eukprot:NP_499975.2 C-type LECtin [Caenorhabditis elegans]